MEKLCPLPRSQGELHRPPAPRHSGCWEAAALGEGFGRAPCTSSVFLAPAPPDCGPARTIVKNKNPGGAPARGTQLSRLLWVGVCCWGGDPGVVAESGTAWHVGKGCCQGLRDCSGTMSPAGTYGYWWWRAPLVLGSSVVSLTLMAIKWFFYLLILSYYYFAC